VRQVTGTVGSVVASWVLVLGAFYLLPFTDYSSRESIVRFVLAAILFVLVFVWQLRQVSGHDLPVLRAVRALGTIAVLFLALFAAAYLSLSQTSAGNFSEPLNHTGALYLTITIFSTVGFGDITPKSDLTRILVSVQMLLDLVVIGAVVRLLTTAAKSGVERHRSSEDEGDTPPIPPATE
jgi:voltage-gated potassium channel